MRAIVMTTDPILISYATSVLEEAGIKALTFDQHASIVEGSIGILPRRLMVPDDRYADAVSRLRAAGLGDALIGGRGSER